MPDTSLTQQPPAHPALYPAAHAAVVVREFGPFPGASAVHGVSHDGTRVWAATGAQLLAIHPQSGEVTRTLACACNAGTAFDGKHLWQIAERRINKIEPATGEVIASIRPLATAQTRA